MNGNRRMRILLIVDDLWGLGGALRVSPYLAAVRDHYVDAEIVLLVCEYASPVFERSRLFDRVVVSRLYRGRRGPLWWLRGAKLVELVRLLVALGRGYDLVLTYASGTTLLNVLGWIVGRRRIGYANALPGLLSIRLGRWNWDEFGSRRFERHARLLEAAGISPHRVAASPVIFAAEDERAAGRILGRHGLSASRLAVLHPGSDWACQQWLVERWAELGDRLATDHAMTVVFTGAASERDYVVGIRKRMHAASTSLAGELTLAEVQALLHRAQLCVCVDSAVFELTHGAGVPTVVIAGPTHPAVPDGLRRPPVVLNRTAEDGKAAILRSKARYALVASCHDYSCPLSGLREIQVGDVLRAIDSHAVLEQAPASAG